MLTTVEKVIFLQDVDVFAKIPLEDLAYVAMIADEVVAEPGRVLYAEGDISDSMYLVLDGSIRLQRGGIEVMLAGPRDVFGTWALFDDETRIVTAVAAEESNLLRIDKEDFLDLLADHSRITEGVLKVLASKLRNLVG
ncbi:MAG: cyclic nucleotide-binding domain-containing protein [bacterium]|nr:cyclic nucleotide-binding domain-containing protein [bacterium]